MAEIPPGSGSPTPASTYQPGHFVREFAQRLGWRISTYNLLVEGTTDVGHFQLAADLYRGATNLRLLDDVFSVVAVGDGENGGTKAMLRYFPVLRGLLNQDETDSNGLPFQFIVLLDNDSAGIGAARLLTGKGQGFVMNRDVFLLNRTCPADTRDPRTYQSKCDELNKQWASLPCEIEDLVSSSLLDEFCRTNGGFCRRPPQLSNGGHHYDWEIHAKAPLLRFVQRNAIAKDLEMMISVLKAMRFQLRLPPDGVA